MKYRGVNLGGWLVLERWMTPSLFDGLAAKDEYSFCQELGAEKAVDKLTHHRNTFIAEDDILWLKDHDINALRLPVPHWVFGDFESYVACEVQVDWLLETAGKHGLKVLLDLHTAPGSQNGQDHSGKAGPTGWPKSLDNIMTTLNILNKIAERWGNHDAVLGIGVLNEPSGKLPHELLVKFYQDSIERLSAAMPGKLVIVSDAFQPNAWTDAPFVGDTSVALDMHLYQAFDKPMRIDSHIKKAKQEWSELITKVQRSNVAIIGEWSLGLDNKAFRGLDDFGRDKAMQAFGKAQIQSFEATLGWFFWSYKTEDMPGWSYRTCVERGWLPRLLQ